MLSARSMLLQAPAQNSVSSLILTFSGRFITEQKPVKARQCKIHQCFSLIDTVSPPDVFASGTEMLFCHVCQPLGSEAFFLFLKAEMQVSGLTV